ncbi:MAG: hypothetical protein U1E76_01840 [Planctomycetota bacterium]
MHNSLINNELVRITGRTPVALAILLFSTGTLLAVLLVATGDKGIGDLSREPTGVVRELQRRARPFNLPHTSAEDIAPDRTSTCTPTSSFPTPMLHVRGHRHACTAPARPAMWLSSWRASWRRAARRVRGRHAGVPARAPSRSAPSDPATCVFLRRHAKAVTRSPSCASRRGSTIGASWR